MKENVNVFYYKNGSKIIVENDSNANYVAFAIHVAVGAGDEKEGQEGLAHFLEHLFFKSTTDMTSQEIVVYLENLGARINAQTNDVKTVYHFQCLKENFEKCLEMYSKMLLNGKFDEEEINKERKVVLEEISRSKDSPVHVAFMNGFEALMEGTRFGHSVLGTENVIETISKQEILEFRNSLYTPDKIGFSVCGNIGQEEAKALIEKYFGKILFETNFKKHDNLPVNINPKKRYILENQDRNQAQVYVMFNSLKANDPLRYCLHLYQGILGGGMSSRLFSELREKQGLAYSTWAESYSCLEFGVFGVYIGTSPSKVKVALQGIKEILKDLAENGVTQQELVKAKNELKSSKVYAQDSKMQIAKLNAAKHFIFNEIPSLEEEFKAIDEVTIEQVNNIAKAVYNEQKFVVSVVGKGILEEDIKIFE